MPEFKPSPERLVEYLDESNTPWTVVAERHGYKDGRDARVAALQAKDYLTRRAEDDRDSQSVPA